MPDTRLQDLTEASALSDDDLLYAVLDPAGTPADRKIKALRFVLRALFDANTFLAADTDNTPTARTVGEGLVLGRPSGGNIKALTDAELKTILEARLNASYAPLRLTIPADKTADYTATASDVNASTGMDSATAKNITINTGVFTAGDLMEYRQVGAGQVTIVAGGGVTLRAPGGAKTRTQYSAVQVLAVSSTVFSVLGDTTT